jgi:hypothetical protein
MTDVDYALTAARIVFRIWIAIAPAFSKKTECCQALASMAIGAGLAAPQKLFNESLVGNA